MFHGLAAHPWDENPVEAPGFSPARYGFSSDGLLAPVPFVLAGAKAQGLLRRLVAGLKPGASTVRQPKN